MDVRLNTLENSKVELIIKVDSSKFCEAINKSFKKNVSKYNVHGFRKGKVPFDIFKKMYGVEVLYNDAANLVIDGTYRNAISENNVEVVDYPEIEILVCSENEDFEYKAVVYVKPEVNLGDYKGLDIEEVKYEVSEEDIEKELNDMREKNSRLVEKKEDLVEEGDIAIIDFKGYVDGKPFDGGEAKGHNLTIGSKTFIDNFEGQLVGKKKGEDVVVKVKFPDDYHVENLKSMPAEFEVKINDIRVKEIPELDDNFAKNFSEFDNLSDLKDNIRKKLIDNNEKKQKYEFENSLIEKVCNNASVNIPNPMIESGIDRLVGDFENKLKYQGLDINRYCDYYGINLDDIRNNFRERASKQVLSSLVLEKISKQENICASNDEIDKKAEELSNMYSSASDNKDSIKNTLLRLHKNSIERDIIFSKTVEFLVNENKKSVD